MSDISALSAAPDPMLLTGGMPSFSMLSLKMNAGLDAARIDKTAQDFEAMFASQMLQPMFEGLEVDKTFGGGHGEEVMRSFLLQEYGKTIAKSDKLGIASQVKAEMLRMQESGNAGKMSAKGVANTRGKVAAYGEGVGNVSVR